MIVHFGRYGRVRLGRYGDDPSTSGASSTGATIGTIVGDTAGIVEKLIGVGPATPPRPAAAVPPPNTGIFGLPKEIMYGGIAVLGVGLGLFALQRFRSRRGAYRGYGHRAHRRHRRRRR